MYCALLLSHFPYRHTATSLFRSAQSLIITVKARGRAGTWRFDATLRPLHATQRHEVDHAVTSQVMVRSATWREGESEAHCSACSSQPPIVSLSLALFLWLSPRRSPLFLCLSLSLSLSFFLACLLVCMSLSLPHHTRAVHAQMMNTLFARQSDKLGALLRTVRAQA